LSELPLLDQAAAKAIAPLVGIGGKSGDTVVGLSALRRSRPVAYVFVAPSLGAATLREIAGWRRDGTRVYQVEAWAELAGVLGRADALVLGVKPGSLAQGLERRLQGSSTGE
jgi:hypothetical protein